MLNNYIPVFLQGASTILSALIAYKGLKSYAVSRENKFLWFGLGFLFITFSFIALFISQSFSLSTKLCPAFLEGLIPYYSHLMYTLFFSFGSVILSLVYSKIEDKSTLLFIGALLFFITIMVHTNFFRFSILVALIYGFIASKARVACIKTGNCLTYKAFIILSFSYILFALSTYYYPIIFIPFILELIGYSILAYVVTR